VYVVHAIGNPVLAWWSCIALLGAVALAWRAARARGSLMGQTHTLAAHSNAWLWGYVVMAFLAGWLPWSMIGRCQFLYLYMPSFAFAVIAAALVVDWLLAQRAALLRNAGYAVSIAVIGTFIYFAPIYLAIAISPQGFYARMWLRSWI
jgi:dolichyl-phosphate-mannose-protein mannosyltransferase